MSFWDWLFRRKKPKPPKPPPQPVLRAVGVVVHDAGGHQVGGAQVRLDNSDPAPDFTGTTNQDGYLVFNQVPVALRASNLWVTKEGYPEYSQPVVLQPVNHDLWVGGTPPPASPHILLPPLKRAWSGRTGLVVGSGQYFVDEQGAFLPLGATLFWALRGWKFERDRVKQNLSYLAKQGFDFYRVLGEVSWVDNETDPRWPDYQEQLAGLMDFAYGELGLRTQITLFGAGKLGNPRETAAKVIDVVKPRVQEVMFVEVANEWWQNFNNEQAMRDIGHLLRSNLPNLIALSAPKEELAQNVFKPWVASGAANMATVHLDRSDNTDEWKWRHVRKPWEPRHPGFPASHNEPGGPRSSVAQYEEAIHLVMSRAVGILCGYAGYVLHNAAGVTGRPNPAYGGRPSNVWEVPGIDHVNAVVRQLDKLLPPNPMNGAHTRSGLDGHPLTSDAFISSGRGVVRDYALVRGGDFWQTLIGLKGYVNLKANRAYALDVVDPVDGSVQSMTVTVGGSVRLEPRSRDSRGNGAFIIRGRNL